VSIGGLLKEIKKEVFGSSVNGSNGSRDGWSSKLRRKRGE
jgi:hypothetical protein